MTIKLSTVMVNSSYRYALSPGRNVTVGDIANYLSHYESYIDTATLELARPIPVDQRLQDIDIQPGDRLLVLTQPPKQADMPVSLQPGDTIIKFRQGDFEVDSRGRKRLLLGKPDENQQIIPDIDLRYFVSPESLEYVSRNCLWLEFDDLNKVWYASRRGKTRVLLDEFELGPDPVPLNTGQRLRFYRAADDPRHNRSRAIGELEIQVEEIQSPDETAYFEQGSQQTPVLVGLEKDVQVLNASENIRMGQIVSSLCLYNGAELTPGAQLYWSRLIAPATPMGSLSREEGALLYTPLNRHYARNLLLLQDVHNRERVYALSVGIEDDEKIIGCREQEQTPDTTLDVDLYESIREQGYRPGDIPAISRYQGRIIYRAAEYTWWISADERARMPLYLNNTRLTSNTPIQLTSGDVLSFGPSVSQYYTRLTVEITSRSG